MKYFLTLFLALFIGCTLTQQTELPPDQPELISMVPLPPLSSMPAAGGLKINVIMHVMENGTVENARLVGTSGDASWDTLALQSMKQWRYASSGKSRWIRQLVVVQIQEPVVLDVAEYECARLQVADSLAAALNNAADVSVILKGAAAPGSEVKAKVRKSVNIAVYPKRIMDELLKLADGGNTAPIKVGDKYCIYQRLKKDAAIPLPD